MKIQKRVLFALVMACLCVVMPTRFIFAATQAPIPKSQLMDIARQFVDRVGNKLQKMKVGAHSSEDGEDKLSMIPDGQTLLLRPKVDKYIYDIDLEAIKQKTDVYFLFKDFVSILKLEIDYDEDKKHGQPTLPHQITLQARR